MGPRFPGPAPPPANPGPLLPPPICAPPNPCSLGPAHLCWAQSDHQSSPSRLQSTQSRPVLSILSRPNLRSPAPLSPAAPLTGSPIWPFFPRSRRRGVAGTSGASRLWGLERESGSGLAAELHPPALPGLRQRDRDPCCSAERRDRGRRGTRVAAAESRAAVGPD